MRRRINMTQDLFEEIVLSALQDSHPDKCVDIVRQTYKKVFTSWQCSSKDFEELRTGVDEMADTFLSLYAGYLSPNILNDDKREYYKNKVDDEINFYYSLMMAFRETFDE